MNEDIHPELNKQSITAKMMNVSLYLLLLLSLLFLILGVGILWRAVDHNETESYLIGSMPVVIALLFIAYFPSLKRFIATSFIDPVKYASRLMKQTVPKKMTMNVRVAGAQSLSGLMVDMEDPSPSASPVKFPAAFTFAKYEMPSKGEYAVDVYSNSALAGRTLVIRYKERLIIGTLLSYNDIMANIRITKKGTIIIGGIIFALVMLREGVEFNKAQKLLALAQETSTWQEVDTDILKSSVEETSVKTGKSRTKAFSASVEYSYLAGNKPYTGKKLWVHYTPSIERKPAEDIVAKYPAQSRQRVRYNPSDPSQSVLESGQLHEDEVKAYREKTRNASVIVLAFSLFFVLMFGIIIFLFIRKATMFAEPYRDYNPIFPL